MWVKVRDSTDPPPPKKKDVLVALNEIASSYFLLLTFSSDWLTVHVAKKIIAFHTEQLIFISQLKDIVPLQT